MGAKVKDTDRGYKAFRARMATAAKGAGVSVGVHADEGAEMHSVAAAIKTDAGGRHHLGGKFVSKKKAEELLAKGGNAHPVSLLDVAIWNEFGMGVPERSFLRAWVDQNADVNREKLRKAMIMVVRGQKTLPEALELLGLDFQGGIQKQIAAGVPPPNAPETIKQKGSSTPLIDTGQLRQSITYKVTDKPKP